MRSPRAIDRPSTAVCPFVAASSRVPLAILLLVLHGCDAESERPGEQPPASAPPSTDHALALRIVGEGTIDCGGPCKDRYPDGTRLTMRTSFVGGYAVFSGDCQGRSKCDLLFDRDREVTVRFVPATGAPRWAQQRDVLGDPTFAIAWAPDSGVIVATTSPRYHGQGDRPEGTTERFDAHGTSRNRTAALDDVAVARIDVMGDRTLVLGRRGERARLGERVLAPFDGRYGEWRPFAAALDPGGGVGWSIDDLAGADATITALAHHERDWVVVLTAARPRGMTATLDLLVQLDDDAVASIASVESIAALAHHPRTGTVIARQRAGGLVVQRVDPRGVIAWEASCPHGVEELPNHGFDYPPPTMLAIGDDGTIVVAQRFAGAFGCGGSPPSKGGNDIAVLALSERGEFRWLRTFGDSAPDYPVGLGIDGDGNVGLVASTVGHLCDSSGDGPRRLYAAKLDPAGERIWSHCNDGHSAYPLAAAVAQGGAIAIAGTFVSRLELREFREFDLRGTASARREARDPRLLGPEPEDAFVLVLAP
jgi:hypothetical protein